MPKMSQAQLISSSINSLSPTESLILRRSRPQCLSATSFKSQMRTTSEMETTHTVKSAEDAKLTIKGMFSKAKLSVSAYDTAWVAMVPSPDTPEIPCFPETVKWILENQLHDGSWGLPDRHSLLMKDALSSTLAAVLALKRWNTGEEQIAKGLDFISSSFALAMDEKQHSPIGFDIIFPSMISSAAQMNLNLCLSKKDIENMICKKDMELQRINGEKSEAKNLFLAYISEGLGRQQDWEMAMKYQRKNGSLFNSPSATAAALCYLQDSNCLSYLGSVLQQFGNAVPTAYPLDAFTQLCFVDMLEKFGIDRHFTEDIKVVLDETFRQWMQDDEEIFSDITTCAIAFRLLRSHGYDVSSELLGLHVKPEELSYRFGGHLKDINDALELYRASQFVVSPIETFLMELHSYSTSYLKQLLSGQLSEQVDVFSKRLIGEVDDALKSPYHMTLDRLGSRKYVEHYSLQNDIRVLKSSFGFTNFSSEVLLRFAGEDFNKCQSIHIQEFKIFRRWVTEDKLDQLTFSRQKLGYCYFSAASTLFSPELADARISWAKNAVLTTVVDDFFDVGSSEEEQVQLIELIKKWDENELVKCSSENVKVIFSALYHAVTEISERAYTWQDRRVLSHIVEIWLDLVTSMREEAERSRNKSTPTVEEYMSSSCTSFALGPIVLPTLYFMGPKLSEDVVRSSEYLHLFNLMSTCGRLMNDFQGFQREASEGKLNAVTLLRIHSNGEMSEEEATRELKLVVDSARKELLRLVLEEGSVVPRACKGVFWKMTKVLHFFYRENDGFSSKDVERLVKSVIHDPIVLN